MVIPQTLEEDPSVGLSSEDEATGLEAEPGVARHMFGGPTPSRGSWLLQRFLPRSVLLRMRYCSQEEGAEMGKATGLHPSLWGRPS